MAGARASLDPKKLRLKYMKREVTRQTPARCLISPRKIVEEVIGKVENFQILRSRWHKYADAKTFIISGSTLLHVVSQYVFMWKMRRQLDSPWF